MSGKPTEISETSSVREVTSGVHQGSVLAAILFLIYVNDITRGTSGFIKAFADDFKISQAVPLMVLKSFSPCNETLILFVK